MAIAFTLILTTYLKISLGCTSTQFIVPLIISLIADNFILIAKKTNNKDFLFYAK